MAYSRWANGNQVSYSSQWYRFVIDRDLNGNKISIRWGVETSGSLYDSTNKAWVEVNSSGTTYTNKSISHSDADITWLKTATYTLSRGQSISADGYVEDLANYSGGGGRSSVAQVSYTYPALPPNQMSAPTVTNLKSTTHTVNWSAPSTNGASITGFRLEWQTAGGSAVKTADPSSSARSFNTSGFSPNTAYRVRAYAKSSAGNGAVSAWRSFTTPVASPIAPSTPSVSRNSDANHSLSWSRGSQTAGPYSSQQVLRRALTNGVWGGYSVAATISASSTSYVDTTTTANKAYQYQIRATNASGTATSGASGIVWTTPGVPTDQAAVKNAAADIVVTWGVPSGAANPAYLKYEVSESTNGGSSWTVKTTTAAGATSWTHIDPNAALTHVYRVRAIVENSGAVGHGLASGYVSTNTVQLLTPPASPTNLTSTPTGTADREQDITLTWKHNPLDSSPQTKFTLQHRAVGSGAWTTVGPVTSATSAYVLPAGTYPTEPAFEWQVLTYGLHANPSPYSAIATVQISSVPGVSIYSPAPGTILPSTSLTVTWEFSDPDGDEQGSWEAILFEEGVPVETKVGADTSESATFAYRLQEAEYAIQVRVRDSRGLWSSPDTTTITVEYAEPPVPTIDLAVWDWETGTITLDITAPGPLSGQVETDHLEVWRSIDDGPLVLLADDLPPDTLSYQDTTPTVSGKNTYVVQTVSALPSGAQSAPVDVITPQDGDGRPGVWLSAGPGFSLVGCLRTEVTIDAGRIRERVLQRYAGREFPVEHEGEHVDETWRISGNLNLRWSKNVDAPGSPGAWLALGAVEGPFLLRAPDLFGDGVIYAYVSIDGPTVSRLQGGNVHVVSFGATRTGA